MLFTFPRRFSNSMNLSMIKYFYKLPIDLNSGQILENNENKKLFTGDEGGKI